MRAALGIQPEAERHSMGFRSMADVFLSYSQRSGPVVKALIENLEKLGYDVWYDQELVGGQAWWNEILRRIRDCALFVLVVDPDTLKSDACMREFGYAAALGVPGLPVQVSPDVSPALLPRALSERQIVRFVESDSESVRLLARALAKRPQRGPLPDPLPPEPEMPISYLSGLTERVTAARELTSQEQEALSSELQRALRNPETADGARELLLRLQERDELRAPIYRDIEHALADAQAKALREREQALADARQAEEAKFRRELEQALADARRAEQVNALREPATPPDQSGGGQAAREADVRRR